MIKSLPINITRQVISSRGTILACFVVIYTILIAIGWANYFVWSSPLSWIGLIGFVFLHFSNTNDAAKSVRYFLPAILFTVLTFLLPVKTFLYFSIAFGLLLLAETFIAKGNHLSLFLFVIISPIFNYFTTVFTFPIRLKLSWLAAKFLALINPAVKSAGNIIQTQRGDFSVDAECMGLNMVNMGLLTGVVLLAYYQYRTKSTVSVFKTVLFLSAIFILILVCNFSRIVLLVQFEVPADTTLHEMIGLLCFIAYVMFPATFFIQRTIKRNQNTPLLPNKTKLSPRIAVGKNLFVCISLFVCVAFVKEQRKDLQNIDTIIAPVVPGYQTEMVDKEIVKMKNENALIYIKPIMGFYSTEHSPMICWKGSGYELKKIQEESIAGRSVYTAELVKDKDILFTSWWFDNGNYQTIDQLKWRWMNMRGGADFSIVNVTTASKIHLIEEIQVALEMNLIKQCSR